MSSFEQYDLLGNAISIDHLHDTVDKAERANPEEEEANSSSARKQINEENMTSHKSRSKGSISSKLSAMTFSSMLGGFRADEEVKEKNLEAAERAREARKLAIAEKAKREEEQKYSNSPASRSLFGKDSRYRRASESRRHSIKKSQEVDPAVMREAQAIIRRVKDDEPEATFSDVENICDLLASLLEEQPKLAKRLVAGLTSTATSTSSTSTGGEPLTKDGDNAREEHEEERSEVDEKKDGVVEFTSSDQIASGVGRSRRASEVKVRRAASTTREEGYKEEIVGCRVVVKGGDEEWYDGVVVSYHPAIDGVASGYHHIVFGDGIEATLDLHEEDMYISEE
jgi:hypothetical protein